MQKASALARLRSTSASALQERAADFLGLRASQLNSRVLSELSLRVADDPFAKVKEMIRDLLVHLMEEANEEAEHSGWCDTELSTALEMLMQDLHAQIDQSTTDRGRRWRSRPGN